METNMSRPSQVASFFVQTVPGGNTLCPKFFAFMFYFLRVSQTCVCSPDILRLPNFGAFMWRLTCVHMIYMCSSDFCTQS